MEKNQTLTARVFKGSSTILLFNFLASPIGYLIRILYSRTLSIEMFGLFYAVLAFFGMFIAFNDLGFGYSATYLIPKALRKKNYKRIWKLYKYNQLVELGTSVIISILIVIFSNWLTNNYFKIPEAQNIIYIFVVAVIVSRKYRMGVMMCSFFFCGASFSSDSLEGNSIFTLTRSSKRPALSTSS